MSPFFAQQVHETSDNAIGRPGIHQAFADNRGQRNHDSYLASDHTKRFGNLRDLFRHRYLL